jgi:protein phosphatase
MRCKRLFICIAHQLNVSFWFTSSNRATALTNWTQLSPSRLHRCDSILAFGMTDVGRVRKSNEDNFLIDEALGLFVVGDGMGGHEAGEIASAAALRTLRDFVQKTLNTDPDATWSDGSMPAVETMFAAVEYANLDLYRQNVANLHPEGRGMGTTLTGWWQFAHGAPIVVFHVGDSRLYLFRAGQLTQLTKDQTLYQQAVDLGRVDHLPARNLLLQAVGPSDTITPEVFTHPVKSGDLYLLCSDGLHSGVTDQAILNVLGLATADNLPERCAELIALANQTGGKDNITVLLARCA